MARSPKKAKNRAEHKKARQKYLDERRILKATKLSPRLIFEAPPSPLPIQEKR